MTAPRATGTQRAYRLLLVAYPRSLRREHGDEMVLLVGDRQRLDGEPVWRLWPSLLTDTAKGAVVTRWENLMSTNRAIVLGLLAAIAVLAALSDGPRTAIPVILATAIAARLVVRSRSPQAAVPASAPTERGWRRWLTVGGGLFAFAVLQLVLAGSGEMREWQWPIFFFSLMGGIFALATGAILLASSRRGPVVG